MWKRDEQVRELLVKAREQSDEKHEKVKEFEQLLVKASEEFDDERWLSLVKLLEQIDEAIEEAGAENVTVLFSRPLP
jgi:hypothetical protein